MAWKVEFDKAAERELVKLDAAVARRILKFLEHRVAETENPRNLGEPLRGSRIGELWKYRVVDYRVIVNIEDHHLIVLVVKIGNRRDVYR